MEYRSGAGYGEETALPYIFELDFKMDSDVDPDIVPISTCVSNLFSLLSQESLEEEQNFQKV